MKRFPQFNDDMQEIAGILFELNEQEKKLAAFLESIGCAADDRHSCWAKLISTPHLEERRRLFNEEQELDRRWNRAILVLIEKGYTGHQIPTRQQVGNYYSRRDTRQRKAG